MVFETNKKLPDVLGRAIILQINEFSHTKDLLSVRYSASPSVSAGLAEL
jgi:hypothetical protein